MKKNFLIVMMLVAGLSLSTMAGDIGNDSEASSMGTGLISSELAASTLISAPVAPSVMLPAAAALSVGGVASLSAADLVDNDGLISGVSEDY